MNVFVVLEFDVNRGKNYLGDKGACRTLCLELKEEERS